jgi:hypothetical protein
MSISKFALCLFLPDPPRGPVPQCLVLATAATKRALHGPAEAIRQLLDLSSNTLTMRATAIGFVDRHNLPTEDLVLSIIPIDESNARQRAWAFANEREYHDSLALMAIRRSA